MIIINLKKKSDVDSLSIVRGKPYDSCTIQPNSDGIFEVSREGWEVMQQLDLKPVEK